MGPLADFRVSKVMKKNRKIKWIDEHEPKRGNMNKKDALRTNLFENDLLKKSQIEKVTSHKK